MRGRSRKIIKYIVLKDDLLNNMSVESLVDLWKDGVVAQYDINDGQIVSVGMEE